MISIQFNSILQRACLWLGCETCLPWRPIHSNPNLQVDKVGWSTQTIPCFLLSSLTWIQSWKVSLYWGWCCIWPYCCQRLKTKTFCWLMCLFLLNLDNLKTCIVATFCILGWPARVLTSLILPSNFVITPLGMADLLIIETLKPELKESLTLHSTNFQVPFNLHSDN
jgi:hypothetical protein